MTVPYPEDPPPGPPPPPGYSPGVYYPGGPAYGGPPSYPPVPPPPFPPPSPPPSRRALWIVLGVVAVVAVVAIAVTTVVFVTRGSDVAPEAGPDITELKSSMLIKEADFASVSGGEFATDGPEDDPEWEKIDVDPSECEYMVQYPPASQQVRGELSNPDGAGYIVTLRINSEWPDLAEILVACDSRVLTYNDMEGTVRAVDVPDLPDWAIAVEVEGDDLEGGGFAYVTGYYRGVQIDAEHFGERHRQSHMVELVKMFNAQVDRLADR